MADGSLMPAGFDWKNPDYVPIFQQRMEMLAWLRANPQRMADIKEWYKEHPADFINDWGTTFDPRNVERGLPAVIPFVLFPKQREWIDWVLCRWRASGPGLSDKSRDLGVSWLAVSLGSTLCLFHDDMAVGYGSRKEEYVDKLGSMKALFPKARMFLKHLPVDFLGGWDERKHAPHMRIMFPGTNSAMTGEAGDGIGRGDRQAIYFVDESAHLERPMLVEASLSATTNCRIDISSANGMANPFAIKRHSWPPERILTLHWRDDPRKDDEWYAKQQAELDPVTLAQEVDINYSASITGVLIPNAWVQAAVDFHKKFEVKPTGRRFGAMDVADEGIDLNALAVRHGFLLEDVEGWSGKGDDIFGSVQKVFERCDDTGIEDVYYDADGLGAGVRGDARVINAKRQENGVWTVNFEPFRGSGAVYRPEKAIPNAVPARLRESGRKERKNEDFYQNAKAQAWWDLRVRFQRTFRVVTGASELSDYDADELISISGDMKALATLLQQLSQPTYTLNTAGKVIVDKAPDGSRSPNHADAVMIAYAPRKVSFLEYLRK